MFNSPWIRKPDFTRIRIDDVDYDEYWKHRGWKVNAGLKPRESIMLGLIPAGSKVADIGCGNSLLPVKLKEKGCAMWVGDISETVLRQYGTFGIQGVKIDLEHMKSAQMPQHFDYIILSEVLEHLKNPEQVIMSLKPFTKQFLITVPNSAAYQFRFGLMFKGRFFTQWVYHPSEHVRYWSHTDFLDWLSALGLTVVSTPVADGFSFRGLWPGLPNLWKNLLGYRMVYQCKVTDTNTGKSVSNVAK